MKKVVDTTTPPSSSSLDEKKKNDVRMYAFDLEREEEKAMEHLETQGFVVLKNIVNRDQVKKARNMLWSDICKLNPGLKRKSPETWNDNWFKSKGHSIAPGLIPSLAQSSGAWFVRGIDNVKKSFASIWKTSDLITSMDCVIAWRPWWINKFWKPRTEGLHLDQNPFNKPNLETVQGMIPLLDVTSRTGGLEVVPCSHLPEAKDAYKLRYPNIKFAGDWCVLTPGCPLGKKRMLVLANAGDLILWDSRTIHGGKVGTGKIMKTSSSCTPSLARLSVTVCMTPKSRASEKVLKRRREGFQRGECFNHTPHEAGTSSGTLRCKIRKDYKPTELTKNQLSLLG